MSSRIREVGRFRIVLRAQERLAALGQEEPLREKVEWPKRVGTKPPALRRRRAPRVSYSDIGQLPAPHSAPVTPRVTRNAGRLVARWLTLGFTHYLRARPKYVIDQSGRSSELGGSPAPARAQRQPHRSSQPKMAKRSWLPCPRRTDPTRLRTHSLTNCWRPPRSLHYRSTPERSLKSKRSIAGAGPCLMP